MSSEGLLAVTMTAEAAEKAESALNTARALLFPDFAVERGTRTAVELRQEEAYDWLGWLGGRIWAAKRDAVLLKPES